MRCGVHIPPVDVSQFVAGPSVGPPNVARGLGRNMRKIIRFCPKVFNRVSSSKIASFGGIYF